MIRPSPFRLCCDGSRPHTNRPSQLPRLTPDETTSRRGQVTAGFSWRWGEVLAAEEVGRAADDLGLAGLLHHVELRVAGEILGEDHVERDGERPVAGDEQFWKHHRSAPRYGQLI